MQTFWEWIGTVTEDRQAEVPSGVLKGYELEFRRQLERLIQRTEDPLLRKTFTDMLDCPIKDGSGQCRDFSEYMLSALIRQGIHDRYDIEGALSYVVTQMMMDKSLTTGQPRSTVFGGFDASRAYQPGENPLQARFLTYLKNAISNIKAHRIPRLANVQSRPPGTLSIGHGDSERGTISPHHIPARKDERGELDELLSEIRIWLKRKEPPTGLPLVRFFDLMMSGEPMVQQRKRFGDKTAMSARQVVIETIREYAQENGNVALLNMLTLFDDASPTMPREAKQKPERIPKPQLSPKEQDYASIVAVIEKLGRPVGTADFGRYRRKWLQYAPREPNSPHRNRLNATLEAMVADGVITSKATGRSGGFYYSPGPNFEKYKQAALA